MAGRSMLLTLHCGVLTSPLLDLSFSFHAHCQMPLAYDPVVAVVRLMMMRWLLTIRPMCPLHRRLLRRCPAHCPASIQSFTSNHLDQVHGFGSGRQTVDHIDVSIIGGTTTIIILTDITITMGVMDTVDESHLSSRLFRK